MASLERASPATDLSSTHRATRSDTIRADGGADNRAAGERRSEWRFAARQRVECLIADTTHVAFMQNLSLSGMTLRGAFRAEVNQHGSFKLHLEGHEPLRIAGVFIAAEEDGRDIRLNVRFVPGQVEAQTTLRQFLASRVLPKLHQSLLAALPQAERIVAEAKQLTLCDVSAAALDEASALSPTALTTLRRAADAMAEARVLLNHLHRVVAAGASIDPSGALSGLANTVAGWFEVQTTTLPERAELLALQATLQQRETALLDQQRRVTLAQEQTDAERKRVTAELSRLNELKRQIDADASVYELRAREADEERSRIAEECARLEVLRAEVEARRAEQEALAQRTSSDRAEWEETRAAAASELSAAMAQKASLQSRGAHLEAAERDLEQREAEVRKQSDELRAKLEEVSGIGDAARRDAQLIEEQRRMLSQTIESHANYCDAERAAIEAEQTGLAELKRQLTAERAALLDRSNELQAERRLLDERKARLDEQTRVEAARMAALGEQLASLTAKEVETLDNDARVSRLQTNLIEREQALAARESALRRAEDELSAGVAKLAERGANLSERERQLDALGQKLREHELRLREKTTQLRSADKAKRSEWNETTRELEQLAKNLHTERAEFSAAMEAHAARERAMSERVRLQVERERALSEQADALKGSLMTFAAEREAFAKERASFSKEQEQFRSDRASATERELGLEEEARAIAARARVIEAEAHRLHALSEAIAAQRDALDRDRAAKAQAIRSEQREHERAQQERIDALSRELEQTRLASEQRRVEATQAREKQTDLGTRLERAEKALRAAADAQHERDQELGAYASELSAAKAEIENLQRMCGALDARNIELERASEALRQRADGAAATEKALALANAERTLLQQKLNTIQVSMRDEMTRDSSNGARPSAQVVDAQEEVILLKTPSSRRFN